MHPSGGSHAKIVALPGNNILAAGPGTVATFQMAVPVSFMGTRLVIDVIDTVTFLTSTCFVLSVRHDNIEMIANGRLGPVRSFEFSPPLVNAATATAVALAAPSQHLQWKEWFDIGDIFSITLRNPSAAASRVICYWVTDYGTTCANKRATGKTCA